MSGKMVMADTGVITAKYAYNKSNLKKSRFKKTCRNFAG
jgi:hypothetical protein